MVKLSQFVNIPKRRVVAGKTYTLKDSFVSSKTAKELKARYKKQGYSVRIVQKGGVMHFLDRYHIYIRKSK